MLVRHDDLVIAQPAHAWVSGQLARAWGSAALPPPVPLEPVCLAAGQHDVGWADADLAPPLGPAGRPLSFLELPRPVHLAIWRGAARRMLAQSRYAALLVSLHGTSLYARVDLDAQPPEAAAAIRSYLAAEAALQAGLARGLDPAEVERNRRLILAWDRLSLALCHDRSTTLPDVPAAGGQVAVEVTRRAGEAGGGEPVSIDVGAGARDDGAPPRDDRAVPPDSITAHFGVAPWPFTAARVVVGCEARMLPGRFASETELHDALHEAPWVPLRFALSPG